jgi:hypothetical protein
MTWRLNGIRWRRAPALYASESLAVVARLKG